WIKNFIEEGKEIIITPLPLYHIFSLTANCFVFSSVGALNVLITNPRDIPGFVKELKKWKFTAITGVNTLFNGLLNNQDFVRLDFFHLNVALREVLSFPTRRSSDLGRGVHRPVRRQPAGGSLSSADLAVPPGVLVHYVHPD